MKLILASGSPRRAELLRRMGLDFTVMPADADETLLPGLTPAQQVVRLSRIKAEAVKQICTEEAVILSADTVVALDGEILGKPKDEADAQKMLSALSGREHLVLTGICVMGNGKILSHCEETKVFFRPLSPGEISAYVKTGAPLDKAGGYGIQDLGALFARRLEGDYYNVMGLPLCASALLLGQAGIHVLEENL